MNRDIISRLSGFCDSPELKQLSLVSKYYNKHTLLKLLLPKVLLTGLLGKLDTPFTVDNIKSEISEISVTIRDNIAEPIYYLRSLSDYLNNTHFNKSLIQYTRPMRCIAGSVMRHYKKNLHDITPDSFERGRRRRGRNAYTIKNVHEIFRVSRPHYLYLKHEHYTTLALIY